MIVNGCNPQHAGNSPGISTRRILACVLLAQKNGRGVHVREDLRADAHTPMPVRLSEECADSVTASVLRRRGEVPGAMLGCLYVYIYIYIYIYMYWYCLVL